MTDTVAIQDRIGELCHQFRLPTMGAQSVSRFTAAGHGDALETLLEVLEQEAEDRRPRRISRLRTASRLPAGKTWETFEHDRVPLSLRQQLDQLAERRLRRLRRQRAGLRAAGHRQDPRPMRPGPPAGGVRAGRCSSPRPTGWCRTSSPPSETCPCRDNCASSTATTSCCWTTWATCPRGPRSRRCSSPSSPNAMNGGPWASPPTWSSPSESTSSPTPWPPRRPSTAWSTIRSSWNSMSPATGPGWPSSGVRIRR